MSANLEELTQVVNSKFTGGTTCTFSTPIWVNILTPDFNSWADKAYRKANSGSKWKKPFMDCSHAAGIVVEKVAVEAKQPNSAVRKCVRVQLKKNNKRITAYVPKDGSMNTIDENDEVLVAGFGRKGHAVGDLPGVRFKIVKVAGVSLLALWLRKKEKPIK